eukprot:1834763-Amphidinium_carterae.1
MSKLVKVSRFCVTVAFLLKNILTPTQGWENKKQRERYASDNRLFVWLPFLPSVLERYISSSVWHAAPEQRVLLDGHGTPL